MMGQHVMGLVIRKSLLLTGSGLALGLIMAFAATRVLGQALYAVSPQDPLTFSGIALGLTGVAFMASYLPARRATRIEPVIALRHD